LRHPLPRIDIRDARDASVAQRHIAAMRTVPASLANDLTRLTIPALVVHGTDDPLVPVDHGAALARLIPGCRLRLIASAGHMFFHRDLWVQMAAHILSATARPGSPGTGRSTTAGSSTAKGGRLRA